MYTESNHGRNHFQAEAVLQSSRWALPRSRSPLPYPNLHPPTYLRLSSFLCGLFEIQSQPVAYRSHRALRERQTERCAERRTQFIASLFPTPLASLSSHESVTLQSCCRQSVLLAGLTSRVSAERVSALARRQQGLGERGSAKVCDSKQVLKRCQTNYQKLESSKAQKQLARSIHQQTRPARSGLQARLHTSRPSPPSRSCTKTSHYLSNAA